jgi:hypothetical protein
MFSCRGVGATICGLLQSTSVVGVDCSLANHDVCFISVSTSAQGVALAALFFRVVAKLHRQPGIAVITESRLENHQTGSLDRAQINVGTSERVFGVKCVVIAHWKLRFALSYYWAMIVPRISAVAMLGMICCTLESPSEAL